MNSNKHKHVPSLNLIQDGLHIKTNQSTHQAITAKNDIMNLLKRHITIFQPVYNIF